MHTKEKNDINYTKDNQKSMLRSIMESIMQDIMFNVPDMKNVKTVTVTQKYVTEGANPEIEFYETA